MKKGQYKFTPNGSKVDAIMSEAKPGIKAGNEFLENIVSLGRQAQRLSEQSAKIIHTDVENIIKTKSTDVTYIEKTLDSLLDCILWGFGEKDFKRLLNYLKPICEDSYVFYKKEYNEQ
jgi:hypothetical protein